MICRTTMEKRRERVTQVERQRKTLIDRKRIENTDREIERGM